MVESVFAASLSGCGEVHESDSCCSEFELEEFEFEFEFEFDEFDDVDEPDEFDRR